MSYISRTGPFGALMDEYERAAADLFRILSHLTQEEYTRIRDTETEDPDCVSIQSVMNHLVSSGYSYSIYIRTHFGEAAIERKKDQGVDTPAIAAEKLRAMLAYAEETLQTRLNMTFDDIKENVLQVAWGQHYDAEQLMEHAVMHIHRHRRQIEKFLAKS